MSENALTVEAAAEFGEAEAARRLGISKSTLLSERMAGKIHPMRMGQRIIKYTDAILAEYRESCRNVPERLEATGSASAQGRITGAERGSTPTLDRRDAHRLAQATFKRQR